MSTGPTSPMYSNRSDGPHADYLSGRFLLPEMSISLVVPSQILSVIPVNNDQGPHICLFCLFCFKMLILTIIA